MFISVGYYSDDYSVVPIPKMAKLGFCIRITLHFNKIKHSPMRNLLAGGSVRCKSDDHRYKTTANANTEL